MITTSGKTYGIHLDNIAFDIGATKSIMSQRVAKKYNLILNDTGIKIKVADNNYAKVLGETDELLIEIKNKKVELSFVVLEHNNYDVLLGLDFFIKSEACIFPKQGLLSFTDGNVWLREHSDIDEECLFMKKNDNEDIVPNVELIDWEVKSNEIKPTIELPHDASIEFNKLIPKIKRN